MDAAPLFIFAASALLLVSIFTSLVSMRVGTPLLVLFLGIGILAGPHGLGLPFHDPQVAFIVGSAALALILFESGFDTGLHHFKHGSAPALSLATVGVAITMGVFAAAAHWLGGFSWPVSLLFGALVASTDAAAVFFLMRVGGIHVRDRVRSTLEIESGSNDPMAIFLVLALLQVALNAGSGEATSWGALLLLFVEQMGIGLIGGLIGGQLIRLAVNRTQLEAALYPIVTLGMGLLIFAAVHLLHGSGFLAAYVAGVIAGNSQLKGNAALRHFHDGLAWLAQIVMFVLLGMLVDPAMLLRLLPLGLALAGVLIVIARPLAIWVGLAPFKFSYNERRFMAWVGLRGATSILLALAPVLEGLPEGQVLFHLCFIIVCTSLLVQGWTLGFVAKRLQLILPERHGPVERVEMELPGADRWELVSYRVREDSPVATGERLPRWARPSLVIRGAGEALQWHRVGHLQTGDRVYLFARVERVPLLDRLFASAHPLDAEEDRHFFGDLALDPTATLYDLADAYGLDFGELNPKLPLSTHLTDAFPGGLEPGDRLRIGSVEIIARDVLDGRVIGVGLLLEPPEDPDAHLHLFMSPRAAWKLLKQRLGRKKAA